MFVFGMKNFLKYILAGILALVIHDSAREVYSSEEYHSLSESQIAFILDQEVFLSSPETDLCPPRQVSSISVPRVQNSVRRNDNSGRQNFEFIKSGKTVSAGTKYLIQNKLLFQHSPFLEPGHKLSSLCRFII